MKDKEALIDMKKLFLPSSNYWKIQLQETLVVVEYSRLEKNNTKSIMSKTAVFLIQLLHQF